MAEDLQAKIIAVRKEIDQIKEDTRRNREEKEDTTSRAPATDLQ